MNEHVGRELGKSATSKTKNMMIMMIVRILIKNGHPNTCIVFRLGFSDES